MEGSMTAIDRRKVLSAVAAVPAALAVPACANADQTGLAQLIDEHSAAWKRLSAANRNYGKVEERLTKQGVSFEDLFHHRQPALREAHDGLVQAYSDEEDVRIQLVLRAPRDAEEADLRRINANR
jgi:hypothetical protein